MFCVIPSHERPPYVIFIDVLFIDNIVIDIYLSDENVSVIDYFI